MSNAFLIIAAQFAAGVGVLLYVEMRRTRAHGPDPVSLFMVLLLVQCGLPAIGLFGALPFADTASLTGNSAFDNILRGTTLASAQLVFLLAAWFVVSFYVGVSVCRLGLRPTRVADVHDVAALPALRVRERPLLALLVIGLIITLASFMTLGDSWASRYANLILFRAGFAGIERTAFNANAFSLTQAWSWLSVLCLLSVSTASPRRRVWWLVFTMAVVFAVLGGSRRALAIPLVLAYCASVLQTGKWRAHRVALAAVPAFLWLAYGKAILAAVAFGGSAETVASEFSSAPSVVLRASAEAGITVVESLGTITSLDLPPRFGVDHALSLIRRLPDGLIGYELDLPERIVRVSTTALVGPDALDMPPGLMGQMWLDFRAVGAVIWGLLFGVAMGVVQHRFQTTRRTLGAAAVYSIATFLIALPLNSGSLDFNFTVDTILVMVALAAVVSRERATGARYWCTKILLLARRPDRIRCADPR